MKAIYNILLSLCILCCTILTSCDVHQFPDPSKKELPFVLHLNYDTNLPLYKIVEYEDGTRSQVIENYDIRYIVKVYPAGDSREELHHFEFFKDDISELNNSVTMTLRVGNYKFVVWTDYVSSNERTDLHYNTQLFEEIALQGEKHAGCNDLRDAFSGTVETVISDDNQEATIEMGRPLAKFSFISTDLEEFNAHLINLRSEREKLNGKQGDTPIQDNTPLNDAEAEEAATINLSDLKVVFRYYGFMPCSFNMFTDRPASASTGVSFESKIEALNNNEANLGFDYVFVNGSESSIHITVDVYDKDGTQLSSFKTIEVPLIRSKLTVIKANFLTSKADGGVSIIPDFDGEFNFEVE